MLGKCRLGPYSLGCDTIIIVQYADIGGYCRSCCRACVYYSFYLGGVDMDLAKRYSGRFARLVKIKKIKNK